MNKEYIFNHYYKIDLDFSFQKLFFPNINYFKFK